MADTEFGQIRDKSYGIAKTKAFVKLPAVSGAHGVPVMRLPRGRRCRAPCTRTPAHGPPAAVSAATGHRPQRTSQGPSRPPAGAHVS